MDRKWIRDRRRRYKQEYIDGVESFLQVAEKHLNRNNKTPCPCINCQNKKDQTIPVIQMHLAAVGMLETYEIWHRHGEKVGAPPPIVQDEPEPDDFVHNMLNDIFPIFEEAEDDDMSMGDDTSEMGDAMENQGANVHRLQADTYEDLLAEANREFFPGCDQHSALTAMIKLMHCKVDNHWSNKSFTTLMETLYAFCPKPNNIPKSFDEAKKMLKKLGLGYEKIDVCKNDCALFYKDNAREVKCPECGADRYKPSPSSEDGKKGKNIPHKVLRYFPLKPRLERLFMSRHTATEMRWHKRKRADQNGVMRHPADSIAWKEFDKMYPDFAMDPRNVMLFTALIKSKNLECSENSFIYFELCFAGNTSSTFKPTGGVARSAPKFISQGHIKKTYGNMLRSGSHAASNSTSKRTQIEMDDEQINPIGNCREPVKKGRGITKEPGTSTVINPKKKRVEIQMDFEHYTPDENSDPPLVPDQPLKKTRGITIGMKASNIVSATKQRIPIKMDKDQKLPETIQANAMFVNEIGSFTRKLAPLKVKWWKDVTEEEKNDIKQALTTNFDFDWTDLELRRFVEKKMGKAYGSWRNKLHGHFKKYADDVEYARAHPPEEKLFGERSLDEWEWLCDEVFMDESYVKRSQKNAENRNKKEYNHCGGSRPYQKHMEAALQKGKKVTSVENWTAVHQHQDGQWINEAAEQRGNKMLAELNQTKEKLAKVLGAASLDEIEVPVSMQLNILEKGVGKAKGRGIRGLGYGPRKECNSSSESGKSSASMTEQNVVKLTATVQRLLRHLRHIEAQLATVEGYDVYDNEDDDVYNNEDDDVNMYGDGEGEEDEGAD